MTNKQQTELNNDRYQKHARALRTVAWFSGVSDQQCLKGLQERLSQSDQQRENQLNQAA